MNHLEPDEEPLDVAVAPSAVAPSGRRKSQVEQAMEAVFTVCDGASQKGKSARRKSIILREEAANAVSRLDTLMGNVAVAGVVNKAKNQFVKKVESSRAEKAEGHSGSGQVPQASKGRNPVLHQILCNVQRSAQRAGKSSSGSQEPMEATDDSTSAPPSEDRTCHPVMNLIVGNVQQRAIDAHFDRLPKSEPAADEEPAGYCCSINTLADGTKIGSTEQVATEGQQESVGADQPSMLRSLGTQIRARLQRRVTAQAGERVEVPVQAAHTNLGEHNSDIISVSLSEYRDLQNGHRATRAVPALRSAPMTVTLPEFLKEPADDSPVPGKLEARNLLVQIPLLPTAPYGTKSSPYSPISRSPLYRQPRGSTAPAGQTRGGGVLSPGGRTRVARNSLFNLEKPGSPPSSRHGSFLKAEQWSAQPSVNQMEIQAEIPRLPKTASGLRSLELITERTDEAVRMAMRLSHRLMGAEDYIELLAQLADRFRFEGAASTIDIEGATLALNSICRLLNARSLRQESAGLLAVWRQALATINGEPSMRRRGPSPHSRPHTYRAPPARGAFQSVSAARSRDSRPVTTEGAPRATHTFWIPPPLSRTQQQLRLLSSRSPYRYRRPVVPVPVTPQPKMMELAVPPATSRPARSIRTAENYLHHKRSPRPPPAKQLSRGSSRPGRLTIEQASRTGMVVFAHQLPSKRLIHQLGQSMLA